MKFVNVGTKHKTIIKTQTTEMECNYTHSSAFQIAKLPSSSPHTNELLRQKKKQQSICQAKQQNSIQRLMLKWLDFYLRSKSHRPIGYRRAKAARINSRHFRQFPKAQNADRQNSVRRAQERTNEKNCCGFRNPKCGCTFDFFCLSSWQKITVCF